MNFQEFYSEHYLLRHADWRCRFMHGLGLCVSAVCVALIIYWQAWWLLILAPLPTFLLAWLGHVIVRNRPTFFQYPLMSIRAFWKFMGDMLLRRV